MITIPNPLTIDPKWLPESFDEEKWDKFSIKFSIQEKRAMKKRRQIPVSQWAEKHRVLPSDAAIPGKWKNATVPYLAGIMDASFFPSVQQIIVCAPPQSGKSDAVNTCLGYGADRKPGNALVVYPDEITAKDNSKDRLQPMFKDSSRLRSYMTGYVDDAGSLRINLQHMKIFMAWANSASRLGNKPLPYVVLDEEDKYPPTANKKETTPTDLAKKRTRTFPHMRKIWRMSTPTIETGPIWQALNNETEVIFVFWVRCPKCNGLQFMKFENIKWPEDLRDPVVVESKKPAWYECEKCHEKWDDAERNQAVRQGEWLDKKHNLSLMTVLNQLKPISIGFHLQSWLSPFVSLSEVAAAFLWSLKDKNKLKDFKNGHCAEPWKTIVAERSEDRILALKDERPRGRVPGGGQVACLLAGVDTQDDGFYYEIRAFGYGMEFDSWCVREGFVTTFNALAKVLWDDEYLDVNNNVYPVRLALQDAMGHRTAKVYNFCCRKRGKIYPTQGKDTMAQPYAYSNIEYYPGTKKPIPGGVQLIRFDTNFYKNDLASKLEIIPGDPGAWYYHSETTRDWAYQMTVEGLNEKNKWECPPGKPNHAWDCSALLLLAHDILGVKFWPRPGQEMTQGKKGTPKSSTSKKAGRRRW